MRLLEIDDNEFINLNKVLRVKIKDNRLIAHNISENPDINPSQPIPPGFSLEFELENKNLAKSKNFETVEGAKMWLFEHTK
jgi:hypothetical protein